MDRARNIRFAFFGSSRLSAIVLDELEKVGFMPACIVTTDDKPKGRSLEITPNVVKEWAIRKNIPLRDRASLNASDGDVFIVASYGKIIPKSIIDMPKNKTLNIHPSLLPKYRGPSPLPTAMLDDAKNTGVTIMRLDEEMDHGPIVAQEEVIVDEWPTYEDFEEIMARKGARLLARVLPDWVAGKIVEKPQDHSLATYTKKIVKEDGLVDPADLATGAPREKAYDLFRKIQAFHQWPQAYFFAERGGKDIRVKIISAAFKDGGLVIEKVVPEGKKEMTYEAFLHGQRS